MFTRQLSYTVQKLMCVRQHDNTEQKPVFPRQFNNTVQKLMFTRQLSYTVQKLILAKYLFHCCVYDSIYVGVIWPCSVTDMKTRNTKEFFVHPYKKTNIGRRTGKDIRAGKNIRKDADGYEIFEDYFSESDADLTLNQTVKLSNLTTRKENIENEALIEEENVNNVKEQSKRTGRNIKAGKVIRKDKDGYEMFEDYWSESEADSSVFSKSSISTAYSERDKSLRKPLETRRPVTGSTFREEENPVAWIKNKNIGRRTGRNIKAGKNIRRDSLGYEKFEDYFSESEVDSLMESRLNESTLEKSKRFSRKSESIIESYAQHSSEDVRFPTDSVNLDTPKHSRHVSENTAFQSADQTASHLNTGLSPDKNSVTHTKNSQDDSETDATQSSQNTTLSEGDADTKGGQNTYVSESNNVHQNISKNCINSDNQGGHHTDVSDTNNTCPNTSEDCVDTDVKSNRDSVVSDSNDSQCSQNNTISNNENTENSQNNTVTDTNSTNVSHNTEVKTYTSDNININTKPDRTSDSDNTQSGQSTENNQHKLSILPEKNRKQSSQNTTLSEKMSNTDLRNQKSKILSSTDSSSNQSSKKTLSESRNDSLTNTARSQTRTTSKARKSKAKSRNSCNATVTDTSMGTDSVILEDRNSGDVDSGKNITSAIKMSDTSCNTSRTRKRKILKTKKSTGKSKDSDNFTVTDDSKSEGLLEEKTCIDTTETGENIYNQSRGEISQKAGVAKTRNTSTKTKERQDVTVSKDDETAHDEKNTENSQETGISKARTIEDTKLSREDKTDSSTSVYNFNFAIILRISEERTDNVNVEHASKLHVTDIQKSVIDEDTPHLSWKAPSHQPDGPTINIGGNITGSITRCEDKTLHATGVTPALSFRTRKRLSYSVAEADQTLHVIKPGRRSDPTSDCSISTYQI
ncbi:hypothetical protein KUTeg_016127 [Tegillarca granosa]|uniref:Uncharacterized protein n=1 Tax=Tegillarca granosa TaxID=220873 RepID=A0ABQ9ENR9_TEGGR|nr:hypothetical protein KUTeg_016127 [Tegillarca granosa]